MRRVFKIRFISCRPMTESGAPDSQISPMMGLWVPLKILHTFMPSISNSRMSTVSGWVFPNTFRLSVSTGVTSCRQKENPAHRVSTDNSSCIRCVAHTNSVYRRIISSRWEFFVPNRQYNVWDGRRDMGVKSSIIKALASPFDSSAVPKSLWMASSLSMSSLMTLTSG